MVMQWLERTSFKGYIYIYISKVSKVQIAKKANKHKN